MRATPSCFRCFQLVPASRLRVFVDVIGGGCGLVLLEFLEHLLLKLLLFAGPLLLLGFDGGGIGGGEAYAHQKAVRIHAVELHAAARAGEQR